MADRYFEEPTLAALYDFREGCQDRDDFQFYLPMIMDAQRVLDVGCGTGALLKWARDAGHRGHLVGIDPAGGMLQVARERSDIEWIGGDLTSSVIDGTFDVVVMTGHAFQVLVTDAELLETLVAVRGLLAQDGVFAFETRNPAARAWERWTPDRATNFTASDGTPVQTTHRVDLPVSGELVSFTTTFSSDAWDEPDFSRSTLRFLGQSTLNGFLDRAGLTVAAQFGDWNREPVTPAGPEIITIAKVR